MKEFIYNLKFVWRYTKSQRGNIFIYFILSLFNIITSIIYPIIGALLIVKITDSLFEQFLFISLIYMSITIIDDTISYFKSILYQKIFRDIFINIQYDLGKEILKLSNGVLNTNGSGVFIQRLNGDTRSISHIFTSINTTINDLLSNIGILVTYFIISKLIFIFIVLFMIIRYLIENKRINVYVKNNKEFKKINDSITGYTGELVRGCRDIKMLNAENSFLEDAKNKFINVNIEKYKMEKTNFKYSLVRRYFSALSYFTLLVLICLSIKYNKVSLAVGIVLYNFGGRYNMFVQSITYFQEQVKDFNLSASRIIEIFNSDKFTKEEFGNKHLDNIKGDFEFKNVTFKYDKKKVLNNISFKVNSNETVAFVGKSGSGKSTIFNLLCKMYDDYKGSITIDGINIKELDKDSIRGNITIVSQNPYIFNMSIKDNLRLVKKDITMKEIKEACRMACLDDFIEELPDKYDTIVGEGGVMLSGGQKQRLAIARAFVQKTEIILFDEATSALDNETQSKIQQAIDNLKKDYTILIIAHRLSTIKNADRIVLIDNGKIIDEGSHEYLLSNSKEYKKLYVGELIK